MDVSNFRVEKKKRNYLFPYHVIYYSIVLLAWNAKVICFISLFQYHREFCNMVKKILIYLSEDVKKMTNFKQRSLSECEVSVDSEHRAET